MVEVVTEPVGEPVVVNDSELDGEMVPEDVGVVEAVTHGPVRESRKTGTGQTNLLPLSDKDDGS